VVTAALVVQAAFLERLPTMLAVAVVQTTVLLVLKVALAVQAVAVMVTTEQLRVRLVLQILAAAVAAAARLEQQVLEVLAWLFFQFQRLNTQAQPQAHQQLRQAVQTQF